MKACSKESTKSNSWHVPGVLGLMLISSMCHSVAILIGSPGILIMTSAFAISAAFFAAYVVFSKDCKPAQVIENTGVAGQDTNKKLIC